MYRIIIAGSRTFDNYELLEESLNEYIAEVFQKKVDSIEIISGTAKGADSLGEKYAIEHNYLIKRFPADWNKYGKSAGYIRNEKIEEACWLLVYTEKTSIEIATDLSFSSHSYFISVFKKVTGTTPKEYRNKNFRKLT